MKFYVTDIEKKVDKSPSLRGRGLKSFRKQQNRQYGVQKSPSLRGRGLKSPFDSVAVAGDTVALFARAWIEIFHILTFKSYILVALFARAWIEIRF